MTVDDIVTAIRDGELSTRDLVRVSYALSSRGKNTTSVVGQYGEELVRDAYEGTIAGFAQKGYDVVTASGERLQVKTFTKGPGRRPGNIKSFDYDVIVVEVDPETADVVAARRYAAADLYVVFLSRWQSTHPDETTRFAAWGGGPGDRYDRGWSIGSEVRFSDVTHLFQTASSRQPATARTGGESRSL